MLKVKVLLCWGAFLILSSCVGGSDGAVQINPANSALGIQINNQDLSKINFVKNIGQTKLQISNVSNKLIDIAKFTLDNDTIDSIDDKNTTCITILAPGEQCNVALNINGIYTKEQTINLIATTGVGDINFSIPVWNYNWQNTNLALTINGNPAFDPWGNLDIIDGDTTFKVTNSEDAPIYIDAIVFNTPSAVNKLVESENTCGGTLEGHQSCFMHIDYEDVGNLNPFAESIVIEARDTIQNFNYRNRALTPDPEIDYRCTNPGICNINFATSSTHKMILESIEYQPDPAEYDVVIEPTKSNGCVAGIDLASIKMCSFNIRANKVPTAYNTELYFHYRYYIDDSRYIEKKTYSEHGGISLDIKDLMEISAISNAIPASCESHKGRKIPDEWRDGGVEVRANWANVSYIIKSAEFIPGKTNYESYATQIITPEQAIISNNCTGMDVSKGVCQIRLQAGCEGYGSAGTIKLTYTIGNNPTVFTLTQELPKVMEPFIIIDSGYGEFPFHTIWKTGQDLSTPFHVSMPASNTGFNISNLNWRMTGMYTKISDNYDQFKALGFPNCFGQYGMDATDNFYPTGTNPYCGISVDLKTQAPGTSIPFTLWLGNRAQDKIEVIFDIQNVNYKKPIFKGAVK
jgi:hypothetical protein